MKVIDLLNKIANGEEVPKKITIRNDTLVYNKDHLLNLQDYYYMDNGEGTTWKIWWYDLDDEVEIIEEDKKIEKLDKYADVSGDLACEWSFSEKKLKDKINEIIDYINRE